MKTPYHEYSHTFVWRCFKMFRLGLNTMEISHAFEMQNLHVPESVVYNALAQRNRHVS